MMEYTELAYQNGHVLSKGENSTEIHELDGPKVSKTDTSNCSTSSIDNDNFSDSNGNDPICIVGMACHLPGGVRSPSDLWKLLIDKKTGQCRVPKERFNIDGFYHPEGQRAGAMPSDGGYFLHGDVREFENSFFGINNLEATHMDPQQRKLLEVVFECFENAGASLDSVDNSNIGVYVGNFTVDYLTMQMRDPDYVARYTATGMGSAILSNRISHVFNLHGPSLTMDTACSSSIYCLHNAVTAIEHGDCESAIVAGANLITGPEQFLATSRGGYLSKNSACHTFDAKADGYARAEGVSAIYLKRLSSAVRDNDNIRAVIRATAINANGRTAGISQPSSHYQEAVIRMAYSKARLDPNDTSYVECHGTGTAVGDPMEVEGLSFVFKRPKGLPLMLGSVKTNLGHSEAASGLSGIIKSVLALENGKIPASYGVDKLNPKLSLDKWNMKVVTGVEDWPTPIRRASINSFGYGGANGHAILESISTYLPYYRDMTRRVSTTDDNILLLPISAASIESLEKRIHGLQQYILRSQPESPFNFAYTLCSRRSHLRKRAYLLARPKSLWADLSSDQVNFPRTSMPQLPFGFVFTGQGAQYAGMGKELFDSSPKFLDSIEKLDSVLQTLPDSPSWSLREEITASARNSRVNEVTRSQTLCTAIQIGLVDLLHHWNVSPKVVVGHSSGEIAAAYASGLLSAAQAIVVAYYRGVAVSKGTSPGSMMAAGITPSYAVDLIRESNLNGQVVVACVNSPTSVTFSGLSEAIEILHRALQDQGSFVRKLETGNKAYHSPLIKEIRQQYESLVTRGLSSISQIPERYERDVTMFSSVGMSGESLQEFNTQSLSYLSASYWGSNLESPVQFHSALTNLAYTGKYHLIEIGPHSALKGPINQIKGSLQISEQDLIYSPTLVKGVDADLSLKKLAGNLFLYQHDLNFGGVNQLGPEHSLRVLPDLPPYQWNAPSLLWHEERASIELRNRKFVRHELLGSKQLETNGIDHSWRNKLQLDEVPWLRDHKLESRYIFPAACYVAMAMEAMYQIQNLHGTARDACSFEFHNVSIQSALSVSPEGSTEIHTMLSPRRISTTAYSSIWFDFSISNWNGDSATQNCVGSLKFGRTPFLVDGRVSIDPSGFETISTNIPYDKCAEEGLVYGPQFRVLSSMQMNCERYKPEAVFTTKALRRVKLDPGSTYPGTEYNIHPITIDACLQAAIMATHAGNIYAMQAYLPVFISRCRINALQGLDLSHDAVLDARTIPTGFNTIDFECTLRDCTGTNFVDMTDVRLTKYSGKLDKNIDSDFERHPCLRVMWKPDIYRLKEHTSMQLAEYLCQFVKRHPEMSESMRVGSVGGLLDLLGHKNPRLRIMELENACICKLQQWQGVLGKETAHRRYEVWHTGTISVDCEVRYTSKHDNQFHPTGSYDVVLLPGPKGFQESRDGIIGKAISLVGDQGAIIGRQAEDDESYLRAEGFIIFNIPNDILLALRSPSISPFEGQDVLVIGTSVQAPDLADSVISHIACLKNDPAPRYCQLHQISGMKITPKTTVISLIELETPFLATMTAQEMKSFQDLTKNTTNLIWVTGAGMIEGNNADLTLSSGLSRALMLEQPSLRFVILDIGKQDALTSEDLSFRIFQNLEQVMVPSSDEDDKEFIVNNDMIHISRFVPDSELNTLFCRRIGLQQFPMALGEVDLARLGIQKPGQMDTIHFQQVIEPKTDPSSGFIDVEVKAVSLNAKDIYALSGNLETRHGTTSCEYSGIVTAAALDSDFKPGDRVVVLSPAHFRTRERVPEWSCQKMLEDEKFEVMCTLPVIYSTALYALNDRAHLQKGESILIHSGAGALGIAAITLAQRLGATVYTTVSTKEKADFLAKEYGLPRTNIFHSRDSSFIAAINKITGGKGVDVILNSLTGDLLHDSWSCIANFGRFVEVGKRDIIDAGKLDMRMFLRNATFTAFDLTELFYHEGQAYQTIWSSKIKETLELFRAKAIKAVPITTFDISAISRAYRYFSARDRIGKVVVSFTNPKSVIPVVPAKYATVFSPHKTYLLIGCLGGLGRSLSKWMHNRGARKFVFLGRTGCDRPSARSLVERLESNGAAVTVVRGDVINSSDVHNMMNIAQEIGPIGGVIQAAMGLHEAIFATMSNSAWHTGIQPKWQGTWNIHRSLEDCKTDASLDFFLLTSSVSGSVGTATESNYCAANGFLDAFARWRSASGKPTVTLGLGMISEVGYLHENPEIEALLLRKGIQPLTEADFLQIVDMALSKPMDRAARIDGNIDPLSASCILTGLETHNLRELKRKGFDVDNGTMNDPRSAILAKPLSSNDEQTSGEGTATTVVADWSRDLLPSVAKVLMSEAGNAASLNEAVSQLVYRRFSNLILIPFDQVDDKKPLSEYGMDSMIASEFRTWFWKVFKVDVPFLDIMNQQMSLQALCKLTEDGLERLVQ